MEVLIWHRFQKILQSQGESIGEAAEVHGLDPDDLVDKINEFLAENAQDAQ